MRGTIMDHPLTLDQILDRAGTLFPHTEIVSRRPDRSLHRTDYAQMYRRARALAEALVEAGLKPGDRVATLSWNHWAHLECYFGIPAAGGILHTLNLRLHPDDIAYIADHAGDRFIVVDDVLLPLLEQFVDRTAIEKVIVFRFGGEAVPDKPNYVDYEDFLATATGDFEYVQVDERDGAAMCYTSGTTGRPKGVIYTHRGLVLHSFCVCLKDALAISMDDCLLPVVPMFHANAWGIPFAAVMAGSKLVFPGPHLDAVSTLELFKDEQVTFAGGVPTIWMGILQEMKANPDKWTGLHPELRTVVGGSAAPESLIREFDKLGIQVIHGWGMTETSPLGSLSHLKPTIKAKDRDEHFAYYAKQGFPLPYVHLRIRGEDGEIAPWDGDSMGELEIRGPWIAGSYFDNPEANEERWTADGWFKTGDIVTIDPEGYIKITDRSKDVIKSGGEWISSVDLENALMAHPKVAEAAVIAVHHPKWQERPLACIVPRDPDDKPTEDELRKHLEGKFAKWWIPDAYAFIDEVPKTSVGKFRKLALRERFDDWEWPEEAEAKAG